MKTTVLLDEFPLTINRRQCFDYSGKIIFSSFGDSLFQSGKLYIEGQNKVLIIKTKNGCLSDLKFILDTLKIIRKSWKGMYLFFVNGISKCTLYKECLNIYFKEQFYLYPFTKILESYIFFKDDEKYEQVWNDNKIYIKDKEKNTEIVFFKRKSIYENFKSYFLHRTDFTAVHVFNDTFIKLTKHMFHYSFCPSGIEIFFITCNQNSKYYQDKNLRKKIYETINKNEVLRKLPYSISDSKFANSYDKVEMIAKKEIIKIAYDDYYPNGKIVKIIKQQLSQVGVHTRFIKTQFRRVDHDDADFKLFLMPDLFGETSFSYYFIGMYLRKLFSEDSFFEYMNTLKLYWENPNRNLKSLNILREILKKNYILFSVGKMENVFLTRSNNSSNTYEEMIRAEFKKTIS